MAKTKTRKRSREKTPVHLPFHPAAEIYPLLEGEALVAFENDIAANGCQVPIWVCRGRIIDGRNRALVCRKLGITPKVIGYSGPEESIPALIESLNEHRRHLSTDFLAAQRQERINRIAAKRSGGMSLRGIAEEEGISKAQVERDLAEARQSGVPGGTPDFDIMSNGGVPGGTPENNGHARSPSGVPGGTPENGSHGKVQGRDGKTYKATAATKPRKKAATNSSPTDNTPPPANGSLLFDDEQVTSRIGQLARLLNDRAKTYGRTPAFKDTWDKLSAFEKSWVRLQAEKEPRRV